MSVPSSVIHIISGVAINNSYEHTLYFDSKSEQTTYFLSKKVKTFDKFTYLRPGNTIKVAGDVANARNWNYLMFQNDTGKWYYHFITKVVYLSESSVELHIELDVMQTYMFDWNLHPCFIERMHTPTDEFGEHTIEEGLETGPLIRETTHELMLDDNCILILMACDPYGNEAWGKMYGGVYSGLGVYAVDVSNISKFNEWLNYANGGNDEGKAFIDAIVSMWMYPKELVQIEGSWNTDGSGGMRKVIDVEGEIEKTIKDPFRNATQLAGYTVRNQKTFCYPNTMLYVSNNMGGCATYQRERFGTLDYSFAVRGALSPDSGVQLIPEYYKQDKGPVQNYEEALSLPAFPTCAWDSDTYKVWLAQNQNQRKLEQNQARIQAAGSLIAGVGSAVTLNVAGMLGSLASGYSALNKVSSLLAQQKDMMVQPDQARGNHSGNINLTHGHHGFSFHFMRITKEYAESIDRYFTRYGYKVNTLDTPSLHNREVFTYVKTVDSFVTGNLGAEDQLKIQSIFDKGITFWADPSKIGDYYIDNKPLK